MVRLWQNGWRLLRIDDGSWIEATRKGISKAASVLGK